MALVDEGAAAECEIFRANQHTLVIPVGRLASAGDVDSIDAHEDTDGVALRDCSTQTGSVSRYKATSGERRPSRDGYRTLPRAAGRAGIQIICRYDSVPESDEPPSASCLQPAAAAPAVDIGDFSSIVEIDGDCVIIHSRQEETAAEAAAGAAAEAEIRGDEMVSSGEEELNSDDEGSEQDDEEDETPVTPISERCRRFYEHRLQSRQAPPASLDLCSDSEDTDWGPGSVDSGRESGPDSGVSGGQRDGKTPLKPPVSSLGRKMALLRREMVSTTSTPILWLLYTGLLPLHWCWCLTTCLSAV